MSYKLQIIEDLDAISAEELDEAITMLPEWRKEKALRFKFEQGRKECAFSYLLLCNMLADEFGLQEMPEFEYGEHDKPSIVGHPEIHFNLSHCKHAIACAVSREEIGVDVECIGRDNDSLARHVMSDEEYSQFISSSNPQEYFATLWTKKEALVKLTGRGIDDDLKNLLSKYHNVSFHTEIHSDKKYVVTVATK